MDRILTAGRGWSHTLTRCQWRTVDKTVEAHKGQQSTYKSRCGARPESRRQPDHSCIPYFWWVADLPIFERSPNMSCGELLFFTHRWIVVLCKNKSMILVFKLDTLVRKKEIAKTKGDETYSSSRLHRRALLGWGIPPYPGNRPRLGIQARRSVVLYYKKLIGLGHTPNSASKPTATVAIPSMIWAQNQDRGSEIPSLWTYENPGPTLESISPLHEADSISKETWKGTCGGTVWLARSVWVEKCDLWWNKRTYQQEMQPQRTGRCEIAGSGGGTK